MLDATIQQEIEETIREAERPRGAASDALKIVQRHRGWVSDEALRDVAGLLGMSPCELDSIATFYCGIYRRPVGRHVILLCDSVSCWVMGYRSLLDRLADRLGIGLGETTPDGRFTLLPTACLGLCEQAPAMLIDGNAHGNLTVEKLDEVLAKYT